ncbi:MAG: pteridine reductase [Gammaproteobacteria bacterium]|nr:pteridine reductase [Gammaproteobacteria bacterium]MCW8986468.1 pteridine reductase [Gammaproteobacteria bacterium]MCW9030697.1 pteridine reductase [Gammaproteobacteria bacterium]
MSDNLANNDHPAGLKVALITGAAHRIGATTAKLLHKNGMNIVLHYRGSRDRAQALQKELNDQRENSVILIQADLHLTSGLPALIEASVKAWGQLDVLINNASSFYPTQIGKATEEQWDDLIGSNLKAPFFLSQSAAPHLKKTNGCIINIVDIHAERPLKTFPIYSMAKAGLVMMTKSLAGELGPEIRVNAVAPGAILWPENLDEVAQQRIVSRTFLKRQGHPDDISKTILFLIKDANYVTGQIIAVDGGRSLNS